MDSNAPRIDIQRLNWTSPCRQHLRKEVPAMPRWAGGHLRDSPNVASPRNTEISTTARMMKCSVL